MDEGLCADQRCVLGAGGDGVRACQRQAGDDQGRSRQLPHARRRAGLGVVQDVQRSSGRQGGHTASPGRVLRLLPLLPCHRRGRAGGPRQRPRVRSYRLAGTTLDEGNRDRSRTPPRFVFPLRAGRKSGGWSAEVPPTARGRSTTASTPRSGAKRVSCLHANRPKAAGCTYFPPPPTTAPPAFLPNNGASCFHCTVQLVSWEGKTVFRWEKEESLNPSHHWVL